jgi:hypothetical protein
VSFSAHVPATTISSTCAVDFVSWVTDPEANVILHSFVPVAASSAESGDEPEYISRIASSNAFLKEPLFP